MSKKWTTEIDSDIGRLTLEIDYHLDSGSYGDQYTPSAHPSIEIQDMKITLLKPDHDVLDQLEEEILELYKTVKKLRSEEGCPWDKKQTSESLSQYILQEAYEVLESIDNKGKNLSEELGDLLFQIIIQSVIAEAVSYTHLTLPTKRIV